jgi:glutamyl-tRNA synthetase
MSVRVRYAPSPTGSPHVGNLRTAVFCWLAARKYGGQFIARLEDTDRDPARYRPEYIGEIEESLRWLGITPDEWWVSGGPCGPYIQSERLELYRAAAETLIDRGMAYRCFCTPERLAAMRADQQARGEPSGYDRTCRHMPEAERKAHDAAGDPYTIRLAVPYEGTTSYDDLVFGHIAFDNRTVDDQVLLKSNGWPTYHLAVVVDDHEMGISHVIRGEDWMPSTPKQVLLYQALGWEQPVWVHIPLTLGTDRKKLSKRHGATQFVDFMRMGYLPEAMFNFMVLLGWSPGEDNREVMTAAEIVERFELSDIGRNPAIFDYDKLRWMNGEHIRRCDPDRLARLCVPFLAEAGLIANPPTAEEAACLAQVVPLMVERLHLLSEAPAMMSPFFRDPERPEPAAARKWLRGEEARQRISRVAEELRQENGELTVEAAEAAINRVAEAMAISRAPVIHTVRVAVTGTTVGAGLFETLAVLGRERVICRLLRARDWVED